MSTRAAGQRYRIVYRVENRGNRVVVHMVGIRKADSRQDVHDLAERLVRRGLM